MAERLYALASAGLGLSVALALLLPLGPARPHPAIAWLERRRARSRAASFTPPRLPPILRVWLALRLERAGWPDTADRFAALCLVVATALAAGGAAAGCLAGPGAAVALGITGALGGVGLSVRLLVSAASARRARLVAELAPTLELACLELSAGSSPAAALTSVTRRTDGDLARELRRILATAALASGDPLDIGLRHLGDRLDIPALASVAAVVATSRDYGSGVMHGLRAIALDLRRAQRRALIAASRSALTRVLVPAAIGVLMPFLAILLYPAVTSLAANLR